MTGQRSACDVCVSGGVLRVLAVFQVILGIATTANHVAPRLPRGLGKVSPPLLPPLRQPQGPHAVSHYLLSAYPASSSLPILPSSHPPCQLPCPALSPASSALTSQPSSMCLREPGTTGPRLLVRLEIIMLKILAIILFPNSFFPLLLFSYYSAIILILFSNLINI